MTKTLNLGNGKVLHSTTLNLEDMSLLMDLLEDAHTAQADDLYYHIRKEYQAACRHADITPTREA